MTTDSRCDFRWRDDQYPTHYVDDMQASRPPAATDTKSSLSSRIQSWGETSRNEVDQGQLRESSSEPGPDVHASNYHSRMNERRASTVGNVNTPSSADQNSLGPWYTLPYDYHLRHQRQITDVPLTLHIPKSQGLHNVSPVPSIHMTESSAYSSIQSSRQQNTTSLPSFASFQEHASRPDDLAEGGLAAMSSQMSCHLCAKLKPMIRDVAIAVAGLDESMQSYGNPSVTKTVDFPKDSPVRAIQWILDRLSKAKSDLFEATHQHRPRQYDYQPSTTFQGMPSQKGSSPNAMKRSAEQWEHPELPNPKRHRSEDYPDDIQRTSSGYHAKDDRRRSIAFTSGSSPPTESAPGSAHPRTGSPSFPRPYRTLPSPSSMAYPPSNAPSVAHGTLHSVGSPATSYQPTVSIHTASTNSVTSAHMADLQHQVTLKSLALQTLQSEYASLLQKLQREKVKTQAIEKKTGVADREINDLTTRTEELTEQVKSLETELEASESKRDSERTETAREKEQWGRMLEMSGRLHSKTTAEKQRLERENKSLTERLATYEAEGSLRLEQASERLTCLTGDADGGPKDTNRQPCQDYEPAPGLRPSNFPPDGSKDVTTLQREVGLLNAKIEVLRSCLEEARRHNRLLGESAREVVQRSGEIGSTVARVLQDEGSASISTGLEAIHHLPATAGGPSAPYKFDVSPTTLTTVSLNQPIEPSIYPPAPGGRKATQSTASATSSAEIANMVSAARAVSPGPEELGFHVTPSSASPEELIKALGPVPRPHSAARLATEPPAYFPEATEKSKPNPRGRKQQRKQSLPWIAPGVAQCFEANDGSHLGSFRPLTDHVPSPHAMTGRTSQYAERSPYPHYSSPGPTSDNTSASSSASAGRRSPGQQSRPKEEKASLSTPVIAAMDPRATHEQIQDSVGPATAMPPPPPPRPI